MSELTNTEIDRKCAEIMGWEHGLHSEYGDVIDGYFDVAEKYTISIKDWHPSTDLNQAWQVVEKMYAEGLYLTIRNEPLIDDGKIEYEALVSRHTGISYVVIDKSPSRAICLACIQAWEGMK